MFSWVLLPLFNLPLFCAQGPLKPHSSQNLRFDFYPFPVENTYGYTEFEFKFCQRPVLTQHRFTTVTVCAYRCDRTEKCQGFQIYTNRCILLEKKCDAKDLAPIIQTPGHRVSYYLKEVSCKDSSTCQVANNCFAPRGFGCHCFNGFCSPYPLVTAIPNFRHSYCYDEALFQPARSVENVTESDVVVHLALYEFYLIRRTPLIDVSDCIAQCKLNGKCLRVNVVGRFCHLYKTFCSDSGPNRISPTGSSGNDSYIEDLKYFPCQNEDECVRSPLSPCTEIYCRCNSTHQCVFIKSWPAGVGTLVFRRLLTSDPLRLGNLSSRGKSLKDCTDKHICCSEAFPTPSDCSVEDYDICPKSCGHCTTAGCSNRFMDCSNFTLCSDPLNGDYMKAQCPVTCGTCGKTPKSLGVTCRVCKDTLPNCEETANNGYCEKDDYAEKCRRSCGCFDRNGKIDPASDLMP